VSVTVTVQTSSQVTAASASTVGPYRVGTYTSGIASGNDYVVPKIYYPTNGVPPYAGVIFIAGHNASYTEAPYTVVIGGKTVVEADVTQWGTLLASHGFVVMFIDPDDLGAGQDARELALSEAANALAGENSRSASPLFGDILVNKIGVMGHSYGGAGALLAANAGNNGHIAAALGLSPVPTSSNAYPNDRLPSMIISAIGDPYASNFPQQYASIPPTTTKALANFKQDQTQWESMHAIALVPLGSHTTDPEVARLALSFFELYLYGDTRYKPFIVNSANLANFGYANP
jgi:dienelactone hydrolase